MASFEHGVRLQQHLHGVHHGSSVVRERVELLGQDDGNLHLVSNETMGEDVGQELCQLVGGLGGLEEHLGDQRRVETIGHGQEQLDGG